MSYFIPWPRYNVVNTLNFVYKQACTEHTCKKLFSRQLFLKVNFFRNSFRLVCFLLIILRNSVTLNFIQPVNLFLLNIVFLCYYGKQRTVRNHVIPIEMNREPSSFVSQHSSFAIIVSRRPPNRFHIFPIICRDTLT